jgi:hypothetical protein
MQAAAGIVGVADKSESNETPSQVGLAPQFLVTTDVDGGNARINLSRDGGATFQELGWKVVRASRWKLIARQWPPIAPRVLSADQQSVCIGYEETLWNGPVHWRATFDFARGVWTL